MSYTSNHNHNTFSWAGQPVPDLASQQWGEGYDAAAQPMGSADFLDTAIPRNPQSMIQTFNADLPVSSASQNVDLGQSLGLYVNGASTDCPDLPFDLAIGSYANNDPDIDTPGQNSYDIAPTVSQASSNGIDEEGSTLSMPDDLYDTSFNNNSQSPAATSVSDAIFSQNTSLENSPAILKCPWVSEHIDNNNTSGNALGIVATAPQPATHVHRGFLAGGGTIQNVARSFPPNVSALSTGLSSQNHCVPSPTAEYCEHLSTHFADEAELFGQSSLGDMFASNSLFSPYQNQVGPSVLIHPPEVSDTMQRHMDDCPSPNISATSSMHPIDHILPDMSAFETPGLQSFQDAGLQTTPAILAPPTHLTVPILGPASRPRPSNGTRLCSVAPTRATSYASRPRSVPVSSRNPSGRSQRSGAEPARSSGPVLIASSIRRRAATVASTSTDQTARPGTARGRRVRPMEPESRAQAKDVRNKKTVCIRCKHSKQACKRIDNSPNSPCSQCEKHGSSNKWPGPCVKAHFEDIVLSGPLNYVSQRGIYHQTLDGTRRIAKELPKEFSIDIMLDILARVQCDFDIKVYRDGRPLYVLDLDACHDFLSNVRHQDAVDTADSWQSFIDYGILRTNSKNDEWESCMTSLALPRDDPLALLCALTNMPSRTRFSYVFKGLGMVQEQFLDPENPAEADNLILAAQLSRIICRKVEVKGYGHLQRALHKSDELKENEILPLLQRLGCILLTLRWRYSWWRVVGDGDDDDAARKPFEVRVQTLCYALYFYYCSVRRKLAAWTNVDALRGVFSRYQDTAAQVWDDFPGLENVEAFETWMRRGEKLVYEAGVPRVLASTGLLRMI